MKARWAAQDCMSLDGVPYVGRYGKRATGLEAAVLGAAFDVFTAAGCTGTCPLILRMVNASMAMPPSG